MEFRTIRPNELQMWSDLCREVFYKDSTIDHGATFMDMYENDPWKDQNSILVALEHGKIVSTVQIYCRPTMLGAQEIKTGCIGGVCTHPDYRGRGLASRLLGHSVDLMREKEFQLSMLTSGIWSFYEKSGWQNIDWNWKTTQFDVDHTAKEEFTVRPVSMEDMDAIKMIYAQYIQRFNGPVVRNNDDYWNHKIQMEKKPCWVAIDKTGNMIAYLWLYIREEDNYICVIEYGETTSKGQILDRMVNQICSSQGWTTCRLRTQSGVHFNFEISETATYSGLMYRLITPIRILNEHIITTEQLIRYLNRNNKPDSSDYLNWDHENV